MSSEIPRIGPERIPVELPVDVREPLIAAFRKTAAYLIRNPGTQVVSVCIDLYALEATITGTTPVPLDNNPT